MDKGAALIIISSKYRHHTYSVAGFIHATVIFEFEH
jgi:hypothetical protein